MKALIKTDAAEKINSLHRDITELLKQGVSSAIEIGRLLSEKKAELKHGEFTDWIKDNLIFTDRTARNYMRLFENKDRVTEAGNISGAYRLLDSKTETVSDFERARKAYQTLIQMETNNGGGYPCVEVAEIAHEAVYDYLEYFNHEMEESERVTVKKMSDEQRENEIKRLSRLVNETGDLARLAAHSKLLYGVRIGRLLNELESAGFSSISTRT